MSQQKIEDGWTKKVIAALMLGPNIGVRLSQIVEKTELSEGSVQSVLDQLMNSEVVVIYERQTATCHTTENFYRLRDIAAITIYCN